MSRALKMSSPFAIFSKYQQIIFWVYRIHIEDRDLLSSIELKKNRKRTTHHRSAELNIKIKFLTRLKTNQRIKLTNGGPPPFFAEGKNGMIGPPTT